MTTDKEALDLYLCPSGIRVSCFHAALRDARGVTGRDLGTGQCVDEPDRSGNWLGAIGYLLLLDQLGTAVRPAAVVGGDSGSIIRALEWFAPGVTGVGRKAIYALRNALAHDYSLFNKNDKDPELQHEFALHRGAGRLVQIPPRPWLGDYTQLHDPTLISLRRLGDTVELVAAEVISAHQQGALAIGDDLSADDLLQRYTFVVHPGG
jgi:hypothetical protein